MLAANAIERNPRIGDQQLVDILSSNLCRCTGYKNIVEAVRVGRAEMLERLDTDE
jgi:carbon-monoxide dehydrogenase small subunit